MIRFVINRFVYMILTLAAVSMVAFVLIQLPPGDFADSYANKRQQAGAPIKVEELEKLTDGFAAGFKWLPAFFNLQVSFFKCQGKLK